jgi:transposase
MRHVVDAVDKVRKQENKALMHVGDATLAKSKYLWLTNPSNMTDKARESFEELKGAELTRPAGRGRSRKSCAICGTTPPKRGGAKFWKRWYLWATQSRLAPTIEVAKLIACHLPNILTFQASDHKCSYR